MKVIFYVQHLLGIGHLVRASRLADALDKAGHDVTIVSGGMPVQGFPSEALKLIQLQPLCSADSGFSGLADAQGVPADEALFSARKLALLDTFEQLSPDCLIIEAYPFARRQMRFELVPLLDHAASLPSGRRPMVVSSIRDILQPKSPERDVATAEIVNRYFDLVMVHGEESVAPLRETFSAADLIAGRVVYTGMVGPCSNDNSYAESHDVVVSAGGGSVGEDLLVAALEAHKLINLQDAKWLLLAGPNLPEQTYQRLRDDTSLNINVVRFHPDLSGLLKNARVSVSQAGYNTVADVLVAGCASVFVPFGAHGEREQTIRAQRLSDAGRAALIEQSDLTPLRLAGAIQQAMIQHDARAFAPMAMDGAQQSARLLAVRYQQFKRDQSA